MTLGEEEFLVLFLQLFSKFEIISKSKVTPKSALYVKISYRMSSLDNCLKRLPTLKHQTNVFKNLSGWDVE